MYTIQKYIRNLCLLLLSAIVLAPVYSCSPKDKPEPIVKPEPGDSDEEEGEDNSEDTFNYVYKENTLGYQVYRIPALIKAKSGKLMAFAEARKLRSGGDSGDIDMVVRLSEDNGKTWGNQIMIWDDGTNTCGNPVPIVDEESGRVHLLLTWNNGNDTYSEISNNTGEDTRRVFYTYSDDEGLTWQKPKEITSNVKNPTWRWYGTGPVHGVRISKGAHKGRLVVPAYFNVIEGAQRKDYAHVIYSDDNGDTWKSGKPTIRDAVGESTIAELNDGNLMINMRPSTLNSRLYSISTDGGETWGAQQTAYSLLDSKCQGSLYAVTTNNIHSLYFSNPASTDRINMTIKKSNDNGQSWNSQVLIYAGPSGYSDMVLTKDNHIALLYEGGVSRPYEGIAFHKINLEEFN